MNDLELELSTVSPEGVVSLTDVIRTLRELRTVKIVLDSTKSFSLIAALAVLPNLSFSNHTYIKTINITGSVIVSNTNINTKYPLLSI